LTELYLSNNRIETAKGLSKLEHLRLLNLSINKLSKLSGLINLVSLRELNLAKNAIKHIRQIDFL
jgi:protein phosphatase 1 regulatory subunit 7